jgi:hypothetical protein
VPNERYSRRITESPIPSGGLCDRPPQGAAVAVAQDLGSFADLGGAKTWNGCCCSRGTWGAGVRLARRRRWSDTGRVKRPIAAGHSLPTAIAILDAGAQVLGPYFVDEGYIVNDGSTTITVRRTSYYWAYVLSHAGPLGPTRRASVHRPRAGSTTASFMGGNV